MDPGGAPTVLAPLLAPGSTSSGGRPLSAVAENHYSTIPSHGELSYEVQDGHPFAFKPSEDTYPLAGPSTSAHGRPYNDYQPQTYGLGLAQPLRNGGGPQWSQHLPDGKVTLSKSCVHLGEWAD